MNPEPSTSQARQLRAGRLSLLYTNGAVRYVTAGGAEILRHIYMGLRDRNWNTIPARLSNERIRESAEGFAISFDAEHRQDDVAFRWHGEIRGSSDRIELTMDGAALSNFWKNRIGFCILHPVLPYAGRPCTVRHPDGSTTTAYFPDHVSPHQVFMDVRSLSHSVVPGIHAIVTCEGDVFETEDQRNWTDDSLKTYSTPLALPFPALIRAGERVEQRVTLELSGSGAVPPGPAGPIVLTAGEGKAVPFPAIGVGTGSGDAPVNGAVIDRLKELRLDHLRIDIRPRAPGWHDRLHRGQAEARAIGAALEVAVHLPADSVAELARVKEGVPAEDVARWIVYDEGRPATSAETVQLARSILGARAGGGSDANFAELNRNRAAAAGGLVAFSANPQVHGTDDMTIVETLGGQAAAVRTALSFAPGVPVVVSPVTLLPRFNAVATAPEQDRGPASDPRQSQPFTAAWTVASIARLTAAGASSITYYETAGPRGIVDGGGDPYPVFAALRAITGFVPESLAACASSQPLSAAGLVLRNRDTARIVVANLAAAPVRIIVEPYGLDLSLDAYGVTWIDR